MLKHRDRGPAGRRAFSLVELLVVIGIIAMLTAMVAGAAYVLRAKARRDHTRVLIEAIQSGLEDYRSSVGQWPAAVKGSPAATDYQALADLLLDLEAAQPSSLRNGVVVDAWGNRILVMRGGHNQPGLDIWSRGPDGEDDRTSQPANYGDDVVNWGRE